MTTEELQRALETAAGNVVPTAMAATLLRKLDSNNDGKLDAQEFASLLVDEQEAIVASVSAERVRARLNSIRNKHSDDAMMIRRYRDGSLDGRHPPPSSVGGGGGGGGGGRNAGDDISDDSLAGEAE